LQKRWNESPKDVVNARNYAQVLDQQGDSKAATEVIVQTAESANAPRWFVEKAAYQLARENDYRKAVRLALRLLTP